MTAGRIVSLLTFLFLFMMLSGSSTAEVPGQSIEPHLDEEFGQYHSFQSMMDYLIRIQASNEDIMLLDTIGTTHYGRDIPIIKISDNVQVTEKGEPIVFFVGAHHPREWVSYEALVYLVGYLVEGYTLPTMDNDGDGLVDEDIYDGVDNDLDGLVDEDPSEDRIRYIVDSSEIWIVPMLNVDGVIYDQSAAAGGSGAYWRKNLRDNNGDGEFDPEQDGVDLNRNYPYMWSHQGKAGTLDEDGFTFQMDAGIPSADVYRGPPDNHDDDGDSLTGVDIWDPWLERPGMDNVDEDPMDGIDNDGDGKVDEDIDGGFSEPETIAVRDFVQTLDRDGDGKADIAVSLSYHAHGKMLLYPWGYTADLPLDGPLLVSVARDMADMAGYVPKQAASLYGASGDLDDWMYGHHNVLAFTFEVNGPGFYPPVAAMRGTIVECLAPNLWAIEYAGHLEAAKATSRMSLEGMLPDITVDDQVWFEDYDHANGTSSLDFDKMRVTEAGGVRELEGIVMNERMLLPDSFYAAVTYGDDPTPIDIHPDWGPNNTFTLSIPAGDEGTRVSVAFHAESLFDLPVPVSYRTDMMELETNNVLGSRTVYAYTGQPVMSFQSHTDTPWLFIGLMALLIILVIIVLIPRTRYLDVARQRYLTRFATNKAIRSFR